jgi:sialate O-acetylesterase
MRWFTRALFFVVALFGLQGQFVQAAIKLPNVIGSHMVLQRNQPVPVWGWSAPGEKVFVRFAGINRETEADENGRWRVTLPKLAAISQPQSMFIEGASGSQIQLTDILVGEVWFCTGPSNIFWQVKKCDNAEQEIRRADFPRIRFFTVEKKKADKPQKDCVGHWFGCSSDTVGDVSGIGYFFSRRIHQDLDVPVGVLQSFWGGSRIEAWTSQEALEAEPVVKPILEWWQEKFRRFDPEKAQARHEQQLVAWRESVALAKSKGTQPPKRPPAPRAPQNSQHRPACLYNGMVAPLSPFSIRGVICYQGLGNLLRADSSALLLETMIRDWRARWAQGNFPVGLVQPAPFDFGKRARSGAGAYSVLREAQIIVQKKMENVGIAPTLDIDAVDVLHFTNKQLVGRRLACWALASVYGFDLPYAGPVYESMTIEGETIRIRFQSAGAGLATSDGLPPRHFEVAGIDREYYPAEARIDGDMVVVRSERVAEPIAARFAYSDTAVVNLTNRDGLPASLFRTETATPTQATPDR